MARKYRTLLMVFYVIFISACASNVDVAKQLKTQVNVSPNEGILVARIINTTAYRLPFNNIFIDPKAVNASKEIKSILAYSQDKPVGDSSLFSVSLPPGEYSLSVVRSLIFRGEGYYSRGTATDPEFGVFQVEAGKVTDLGTIVYYPKPSDDVYSDTLIRVPETAQGQIISEYFPRFDEKVSNTQDILTWGSDERDEQRFDMYASAAQNPITYSDEVLAPDGSLYFLGKLGVILRYAREDGFETLAIDSDLQVNAFAQNDAGDRIAGGFEGALFYQAAQGDWERVSLPNKAVVHHLRFYQQDQFDVVFSEGKYLKIVRFDKEDLVNSTQLNIYDYITRWEQAGKKLKARSKPPAPHNIKSVSVTQSGDTHFLNVTSYRQGKWNPFDSTSLEKYKFSPDTWKMDIVEESDEMDALLLAGSAEIGIKKPGFWSWTGKPTYFSREDENSPWRQFNSYTLACKDGQVRQANGLCLQNDNLRKPKRESFSFRSLPWFWDANNGLAVVNFSSVSFWSGARSSQTTILRTSDGGKSWERTDLELPKEYCSDFIGAISDRLLLSCNGATSDFFESSDRGQSWQHIRQQQDF